MKQKERDAIERLYSLHNYTCFSCGESIYKYCTPQRAHILSQGKIARARHGNKIIDNMLDWLPACSLKCNGLISADNAGITAEKIAEAIKNGDRGLIEDLVRANIARKLGKSSHNLHKKD